MRQIWKGALSVALLVRAQEEEKVDVSTMNSTRTVYCLVRITLDLPSSNDRTSILSRRSSAHVECDEG